MRRKVWRLITDFGYGPCLVLEKGEPLDGDG